jgi:hypothetical protein
MFDPSLRGTIVLTSNNLIIGKSLRIRGPGADILAISSGTSNHMVYVAPGASVSISDLSFKDSKLTNQVLIYNYGLLAFNNSAVLHNTVSGSGNVIVSLRPGTLTLNHSTISDNVASGPACAIIYSNDSPLTLNYSTVSDNTVSGNGNIYGGGITNVFGRLTLNHSIVTGNRTTGNGGGIYNDSPLTLNESTVAGNTASGLGGGIENYGGGTITNSTISDNTAGAGGGIFNESGLLTLSNSTVSGNRAIGNGGGLLYFGSQGSFTFCTIYGNTTTRDGGGIALERGFSNAPGHLVMRDTLVADNHATHAGSEIAGVLTSDGYNLIQDISGITFDPLALRQHLTDRTVNDFTSVFAVPMELRDNGSPTRTLALAPGSPALDAIPLATCHINGITTDQRGMKRPDGNELFCDIGAYEAED